MLAIREFTSIQFIYKWMIYNFKSPKETVYCGTDVKIIIEQCISMIDRKYLQKHQQEILVIHILLHADAVGKPEISTVNFRAFSPTGDSIFKDDSATSPEFPAHVILCSDTKTQDYLKKTYEEIGEACKSRYAVDDVDILFEFASKPVWQTCDRKVLGPMTGGKANTGASGLIYHKTLREELKSHVIRSKPNFELETFCNKKDYWDTNRLKYNEKKGDTAEQKEKKRDFKKRNEWKYYPPCYGISTVFVIHSPAHFHGSIHTGLRMLENTSNAVEQENLDCTELWFNFHQKLELFQHYLETAQITTCGQQLWVFIDSIKDVTHKLFRQKSNTVIFKDLFRIFEFLRRYQDKTVVDDFRHRVCGVMYGFCLWALMFKLYDFIGKRGAIGDESGNPMNDIFTSLNFFMLKYGLGGGLLSERGFEGAGYFQKIPSLKQKYKKKSVVKETYNVLLIENLKRVYLERRNRKTIKWAKNDSLRDVLFDVSVFISDPVIIVGMFEFLNVLLQYMQEDEFIQFADWKHYVIFYANGSVRFLGFDENNVNDPFIISMDGKFTQAKRCSYESWKKKVSKILKNHPSGGETMLRSSELIQ